MTDTRPYRGTTTREAMARLADSMSSFDEMAVSSPRSLVDLKSAYPLSRLRDRVETTGGGNVVHANGAYVHTTDSAGDSSTMQQSVERGRYVAGFDAIGGLALSVETRPVGDQYVEWGYTDFSNGIATGEDAQGMYTATYKGGVVVKMERRQNWGYPRDKPYEPYILDPARMAVYRHTFRYYGSGPWELNVGGEVAAMGQELPLNRHTNPNPAEPFTDDPNQPLSLRVVNNGTTGNPLTVRLAGRQFSISGDYSPNRRVTGEFRLEQGNIASSFVPLVAFRQRPNTGYGSISTKLAGVSLLSNEPLVWNVRVYANINSTNFLPPSFSDNGQESALEFCTDATTVDNGIAVYTDLAVGGVGNKESADEVDLPPLDLPAQGDIVALCARTTNGATATVTSTFRAREEW